MATQSTRKKKPAKLTAQQQKLREALQPVYKDVTRMREHLQSTPHPASDCWGVDEPDNWDSMAELLERAAAVLGVTLEPATAASEDAA